MLPHAEVTRIRRNDLNEHALTVAMRVRVYREVIYVRIHVNTVPAIQTDYDVILF